MDHPAVIYTLCLAGAYLLGSVPFGLLIGRSRGIDIREHGSGNIGATNVLRVLGKPLGITTFFLDALKGYLPVAAGAWAAASSGLAAPETLGALCGLAAILGHNFPIFLGFKGGKGVATSAGALLGIAPAAVGVGLAAWALVFFTSRYVSLASIIAAAVIGGAGWWLYGGDGVLVPALLTLLALLIVWRHRGNIRRLLNGTENRFQRKADTPAKDAAS